MKASLPWVLLAALGAAACQTRAPGGNPPITINVTCPANGPVTATVGEWRHPVPQGDAVTWKLGGNGSTSLTITPKDTAQWPFANRRPSGGPNADVTSGPMQANTQVGTVVRYGLEVACDTITVAIDPELIVVGHGGSSAQ